MERRIVYSAMAGDDGKKLQTFLKERGFSGQNLVQLRKEVGRVTADQKPIRMVDPICEGMKIEVHIPEERSSEKIPPVELPFPVVYEDEDIVVVNKPAHMPIHPSMNNYQNTLGNAAAFYYRNEPHFVYRCVNRLDRDTTGLTILAKNMLSASILGRAIAQRGITRIYTAIVEGEDLEDDGVIDLPIGRVGESPILRGIDMEHGERAITHFHVIGRGGGLTLVQLQLETGRTHQIRVHMSATGHPLIGDFLYHPSDTRMNRQALHAGEISFDQPVENTFLHFSVDMPEDMMRICREYHLF